MSGGYDGASMCAQCLDGEHEFCRGGSCQCIDMEHDIDPDRDSDTDTLKWPSAPKSIETFRDIVTNHAAKMVDGVFVDMQTANAIVLVYDAISADNKVRFMEASMSRIGSIAWKAVSAKK